jgi:hypothetical protein
VPPDEFLDEAPTSPITIPDDVKQAHAESDAEVEHATPPPRTIAAGTTPPYDASTERTSQRVALDDIERAQFRDLDRGDD